jgi:hypothetical protein
MFKIYSACTYVVRNKYGIRQIFLGRLRMRESPTLPRVATLSLQCATIPSGKQYCNLGNKFRAIGVEW